MTITERHFIVACRLHAEALYVHGWLLGSGRDDARPGRARARSNAEWALHENGWTIQQVGDYCSYPERGLPWAWPPKETKRRRASTFDDAGNPEDAIKGVLRRLERKFAPHPPASPGVAHEWLSTIRAQFGPLA